MNSILSFCKSIYRKTGIKKIREHLVEWYRNHKEAKNLEAVEYITKNSKRVKAKIENHEVLNVLFIIQYIPGWNKLEPIYSLMKESKAFNPIILCVPLSIEKNELKNYETNDTYEYFINHNYEAVNALNGTEWYRIDDKNADYIFHSRPYNAFMPKCYTSDELVKHALICNVLYGASMTKNGQNVTLNRDYFKDAYMYFAFDDSEAKYYEKRFRFGCKKGIQKCFTFGAIGMEQILEAKHEKEITEFDKTVLWTPRWTTDSYIGGSNFFNYKDTLIDLARRYPNVRFIFRPHPLMFSHFIESGEMSTEEVEKFKRYCSDEVNIVLDESKEYADMFWNTDFIITDISGIVTEYFITEKPVMYCHSNAQFEFADYAIDVIRSCYEVKSKEDIYKYFEKLVEGNDYKLPERKKCIETYFSDVANSSRNIVNVLGGKN